MIEPDLPIVDPHHHLWIVPPFAGMEPFPIEQLAVERAASGHDVQATVFVDCQRTYLENSSAAMRVIGETRTVEAEAAAAERTGGMMEGLAAAIVSRADMRLGARAEEVLVAHLAESPARFRGIRHMAPWHPGMDFFGLDTSQHMMRSSAFCEGVTCLAKFNLSFDAWVVFNQLDDVTYLARAVPQATIILNHAGTPIGVGPYEGKAEEVFAAWRRGMTELAQCPNVLVKIGGLLIHTTGLAPHQPAAPMTSEQVATALRRYVLTTIDLFSPGRCMFESNFPIDRASVSYGNLWDGFKLLAHDFSRTEREALFAGTARRAYRL